MVVHKRLRERQQVKWMNTTELNDTFVHCVIQVALELLKSFQVRTLGNCGVRAVVEKYKTIAGATNVSPELTICHSFNR